MTSAPIPNQRPAGPTAEPASSPGDRRGPDWWWVVSTSFTLLLYTGFAARHINGWMVSPDYRGAGLLVVESLVVLLFLFRRRPLRTTVDPRAWLAASGTFIPLFVEPAGVDVGGLGVAWGALQFVGVVLAGASLLSLGRSFGMVAANRGVQTHGLYKYVRHPIYASYLVTQVGYVLENFTLWNVSIIALTTAFQVWRMIEEERVLETDPAYRQYREAVPYRVVPSVY